MPGQCQVLVDGDAACAVHLGTRGLAERAAQRTRGHARGPHLAHGLDPLLLAGLVLQRHALGIHVRHEGVHLHLNAEPRQRLLGLMPELLAKRGERVFGAVHQDDARLRRIDVAELALKSV